MEKTEGGKNVWQKKFESTVARIEEEAARGGERPSLLLHACCAPCSSSVIERLSKIFRVTVFFFNPNIFPAAERERRLEELRSFLKRFPPAREAGARLVAEDCDRGEYERAIGAGKDPALAREREKGERCRRCYLFRMRRAHERANEGGFDWFSTTLSVSPLKDAAKINEAGAALEKEGGARFLWSDFKKKNGFLRSTEISREYGLYRQKYCGCEYSMAGAQGASSAGAPCVHGGEEGVVGL